MDNDNKINANDKKTVSIHKEVQLFLADELKPLEKDSVVSYDLVAEYEKTKKNKNTFVWVLLSSCFAVVALLTFCIIFFVKSSNDKLSINIDTFNDLNLKSLLSTVGRTESMYSGAARTYASLQSELESELERAAKKRESDIFTLQSVAAVSDEADLIRRDARIQNEYRKTVEDLHKKYDPLIAEAEKEMAQYQSQLSTYDSGTLSQAQQEEAVLDSQKQLHDLEMKALTKRFEDRIAELNKMMAEQQQKSFEDKLAAVEDVRRIYQAKIDLLDPLVKNEKGDSLIAAASGARSDFNSELYLSEFASPEKEYKDSLEKIEADYSDFEYMYEIVRSIPQENNIPDYVSAMRDVTYEIGTTMASGARSLQSDIVALNSRIDKQESYISTLSSYYEKFCADTFCDGMVIDASSKDSYVVKVYIAESVRAKIDSTGDYDGQIGESRKRVISNVKISKGSDGFTYEARILEPDKSASIINGKRVYLVEPVKK